MGQDWNLILENGCGFGLGKLWIHRVFWHAPTNPDYQIFSMSIDSTCHLYLPHFRHPPYVNNHQVLAIRLENISLYSVSPQYVCITFQHISYFVVVIDMFISLIDHVFHEDKNGGTQADLPQSAFTQTPPVTMTQ